MLVEGSRHPYFFDVLNLLTKTAYRYACRSSVGGIRVYIHVAKWELSFGDALHTLHTLYAARWRSQLSRSLET